MGYVDRLDLAKMSRLRSFPWSSQLPFPREFNPKAIVFCWLLANSYYGEKEEVVCELINESCLLFSERENSF